jgi:hypothetical protein
MGITTYAKSPVRALVGFISGTGTTVNVPVSNPDATTGKAVLTIAVVTQAQYDALGTKVDTTLYVIVG